MLIISPNVSIDILYDLDDNINKLQRVEKVYKSAGGKGINVARVLKQLEIDCKLATYIGPYNGKYIKDELEKLDINLLDVNIKNDNRLCINLLVDENYEILEVGPNISRDEQHQFINLIQKFRKEDYIVISGSMPKGLNANFYANIIEQVESKVVVDCSGKSLYYAYLSNPFGIKVNEDEFNELCKEININGDIIEKILQLDIELVLVTCGKNGAILKYKSDIYLAKINEYNIVSATGSGDSVLAGLMAGLVDGLHIVDAFKLAMACGISNALSYNTGSINIDDVRNIINEVVISKI